MSKIVGILKWRKLLGLSLLSSYGVYYLGGVDQTKLYLKALQRAMRCGYIGAKIIRQYMNVGITSESHEFASSLMYDCFRKNGGCYIKFGQILSQLEHLLPESYIVNLEPLCEETAAEGIEIVKKIIESEFKRPWNEIFEKIEEIPVGSASLAQVHKAWLKDGTKVAIKVQHKDIQFNCPGDIAIIKWACNSAEYFFPDFKYKWLGDEIQTNLPKEIDFNFEAQNIRKIGLLSKDDPSVCIPTVLDHLSTKRVITMSFEEGKSITDLKYLKENGISLDTVSEMMANLFNKQIYKYGFVHADPHHGNVYIRKENGVPRIVLLDHGLYRTLDDKFIRNYAKLWKGIITQDKELLETACINLDVQNYRLFISILTSKTYSTIMEKEDKFNTKRRLGQKKTVKEKTALRDYAQEYHKEITHVLAGCREEIRLLLKINEFVRNLDRKIGNPVNTYEVMMKYIYNNLLEDNSLSFFGKLKLRFEYYFYKLNFLCYDAYFAVNRWLYPKEYDIDNLIALESNSMNKTEQALEDLKKTDSKMRL